MAASKPNGYIRFRCGEYWERLLIGIGFIRFPSPGAPVALGRRLNGGFETGLSIRFRALWGEVGDWHTETG